MVGTIRVLVVVESGAGNRVVYGPVSSEAIAKNTLKMRIQMSSGKQLNGVGGGRGMVMMVCVVDLLGWRWRLFAA